MKLRLLLFFFLLLVGAVSCRSASPGQTLRDTVLQFNDNVRWQRFREAAQVLPPHRRAAWVTAMARAGRVIQIDEYDMRPVQIGPDYAVIEVDLAYHRHDDMRVRTEKREQVWRLKDDVWLLESDREVVFEDQGLPGRFPELSAPRRHP